MLVQAPLKTPAPPTNTGNSPCRRWHCNTCMHIMHTDSFRNHCTGRSFETRAGFTCMTDNILYMIQYKKMWNAVRRRDGQCSAHPSQRPPLRCQDQETGQTCSNPFNLPDHNIEDLEVRELRRFMAMTQTTKTEGELLIGFRVGKSPTPLGLNLDK